MIPSQSEPAQTGSQNNQWGIFATIVVAMMAYGLQIAYSAALGLTIAGVFDRSVLQSLYFAFVFKATSDLILLSVIYLYLRSRGLSLKSLGLRLPSRLGQWLVILPATLGYVIFTTMLALAVGIIFPELDLDQVQEIIFKEATNHIELAVAFLAFIVVAPIAEELIFRGFIYQGVRKSLGVVAAALISSALFGIVHGQLNVALDTFVLGLFLCYVFEKTGSIWTAIVLHAMKNGLAFYLIFFTDLAGI